MTGYNYHITVPAGTPQHKPFIEEHGIKPGLITNVHIDFPYGCNRMVFIQVWIGEIPLVPDDKGEALAGNGQLYPYNVDFEVLPMQGDLKILAWSPNCTLDHSINIGFGHTAIPKPDTLTPAMLTLGYKVDELISVMQQQHEGQSTVWKEILRRLIGGKC